MQVRILFPLSLLLFSSSVIAAAGRDIEGRFFDKPLKAREVPLPPDPVNPQDKPMFSCFYYHDFMVKEIYRGGIGAAQLSIIPMAAEELECIEANIASEKVLDEKEWSGSFEGAKGNYVFFSAGDCPGSGGFAVYDGRDGRSFLMMPPRLGR